MNRARRAARKDNDRREKFQRNCGAYGVSLQVRRPFQCNRTTARVPVHPRPHPQSPLPCRGGGRGATPAPGGLEPDLPFAQSRVVVAAPALLIEARFRDVPLASRLLRADETRTFTVGAARGADAPVNPAYLAASSAPLEPGGHVLVEPLPGGFALNLAPAMRAELLTPLQALPLRPDFGRAEAPLMLPADSCLRVSCGEVEFDLYAAEPGGGGGAAPVRRGVAHARALRRRRRAGAAGAAADRARRPRRSARRCRGTTSDGNGGSLAS